MATASIVAAAVPVAVPVAVAVAAPVAAAVPVAAIAEFVPRAIPKATHRAIHKAIAAYSYLAEANPAIDWVAKAVVVPERVVALAPAAAAAAIVAELVVVGFGLEMAARELLAANQAAVIAALETETVVPSDSVAAVLGVVAAAATAAAVEAVARVAAVIVVVAFVREIAAKEFQVANQMVATAALEMGIVVRAVARNRAVARMSWRPAPLP